jgi:hypothetical protein
MAKFVAIIKDGSEGCDYTIGCGIKVIDIDAKDKSSAFEKLLKDDHFAEVASGDADPDGLEDLSVRLIEVAEDDKKIFARWINSMTSKAANIQEKKDEAAERARYEKLKKRFEK